jgi:hypothetical protein
MFLLMALFAVFFAWLGARRHLYQVNVKGHLISLEHSREVTMKFPDTPQRRLQLAEIDAQIEWRRKQLGEHGR